jgi:hypothetical protein
MAQCGMTGIYVKSIYNRPYLEFYTFPTFLHFPSILLISLGHGLQVCVLGIGFEGRGLGLAG